VKFLLDMGLAPEIAMRLEAQAHAARHVSDLGGFRWRDEQILNLARQAGEILLTHDLDFAELAAASGESLPSVVVFRLANMRPEAVTAALNQVLAACADALSEGCIISVTQAAFRIRKLPISK
jgi:predicted nuclease of predicted toxin-antitoxin system